MINIVNKQKDFSDVKVMVESTYNKYPEIANHSVIFGYNKYSNVEFRDMITYEHKAGNKVAVYQLEQLFEGSPWLNDEGLRNLKMADQVWDYDINNIELLKSKGIDPLLKPMLYTEELKVIDDAKDKDIDILFYGALSPRRRKLLLEVQKHFNCHVAEYVWGDRLYDLIGRSKIILNLHYYESARQEQVRMFFLLCNNKCIVTEPSPINYFDGMVVTSKLEKLGNTLQQLLENDLWKTIVEPVKERFLYYTAHKTQKYWLLDN